MPIVSFDHKGLEKFFLEDSLEGINPSHASKLRIRLTVLDNARTIDDIRVKTWHLHRLSGLRKQSWSIVVSANWRLTFEFRDGNVYILNYEDYH